MSIAARTIKPAELPLSIIRRDGGTQPREALNDDVVHNYAERLADGGRFPPVTVYYDGEAYWLADGFHRCRGHEIAGLNTITVEVHQGTRRDAVLHSVGANATHGLPRSNADKRRAVQVLLNDEEWGQWSNHEIARRCLVSHTFVSKLRGESSLATDSSERVFTTKHGTPATMNVEGIREAAVARAGRVEAEPPAPAPTTNAVGEADAAAPAVPARAEEDGDEWGAGGDERPSLEQIVDEQEREIQRLESLVDSLSKDDKAAEIKRLNLHVAQLEGRLRQEITTGNEAKRTAEYQAKALKQIRSALGVAQTQQIIPAIREIRGGAAA